MAQLAMSLSPQSTARVACESPHRSEGLRTSSFGLGHTHSELSEGGDILDRERLCLDVIARCMIEALVSRISRLSTVSRLLIVAYVLIRAVIAGGRWQTMRSEYIQV